MRNATLTLDGSFNFTNTQGIQLWLHSILPFSSTTSSVLTDVDDRNHGQCRSLSERLGRRGNVVSRGLCSDQPEWWVVAQPRHTVRLFRWRNFKSYILHLINSSAVLFPGLVSDPVSTFTSSTHHLHITHHTHKAVILYGGTFITDSQVTLQGVGLGAGAWVVSFDGGASPRLTMTPNAQSFSDWVQPGSRTVHSPSSSRTATVGLPTSFRSLFCSPSPGRLISGVTHTQPECFPIRGLGSNTDL